MNSGASRIRWVVGASLLLLPSCAPELRAPVPPDQLRSATHAALEAVLGNGPTDALALATALAVDADTAARRTTGLADALSVLDAVVADRELRIQKLEVAVDQLADPLTRKLAWNLLESDDRWLAHKLERNTLYSRFAGFWNGMWQMAYAVLQANPFGIARPLVTGVEGVIQREGVDPLDRKKVHLHRRWVRRHGDVASTESELKSLREDLDDLRRAMLEEELGLAELLIEWRRPEAALAHTDIARRLGGDEETVAALERSIRDQVSARSDQRLAALAVRRGPDDEDGAMAEAVLASSYATIAVPRAGDEVGVAEVRAAMSSAAWRYVLTGRRTSADPLLRRRQVRRDMHRSIAEVLSVVLWPPISLVRGVHVLVGEPIDDQPLVEALSASLLHERNESRRRALLEELLDRYADREEFGKALAIAGAIGADPERVRELEASLVARTPPESSREPRRASIPVAALGSLADELGIDTDALRPPRVDVTERGVSYAMVGTPPVERDVRPEVHARLAALAEEWRWRRLAVTRSGYAEMTEGIPLGLKGGIGASGVSVIPKFLPERYFAKDRPLFE